MFILVNALVICDFDSVIYLYGIANGVPCSFLIVRNHFVVYLMELHYGHIS